MRPVKLITDVVVEEVLCSGASMSIHGFNPNQSICYATDEVLHTSSVQRYVVPVKQWMIERCCGKSSIAGMCLAEACTEGREVTVDYIAVSPQLEDTIGKYIKILSSELENAKSEANTYRQVGEAWKLDFQKLSKKYAEASFWQRLKYLFTGRMEE